MVSLKLSMLTKSETSRLLFWQGTLRQFIRGLVNESVYDTSEEDLKNDLQKIDNGSFSSLLTQLISSYRRSDLWHTDTQLCAGRDQSKGLLCPPRR